MSEFIPAPEGSSEAPGTFLWAVTPAGGGREPEGQGILGLLATCSLETLAD